MQIQCVVIGCPTHTIVHETVSVRSQDFMGDYVKGINETGINPFTGKAVDKGTQTMAEAYQSFRGVSQTLASISAAVADFSGLFVEDNINQTPPPNYREQVLKNIEESQRARKSSNFSKYLEIEGATKKYLSTLNGMSFEDARKYTQWNKYAEAGISPEDRVRVLEISEKAPKVEYQEGVSPDDILAMPKKDRPNPEEVYKPSYIEAHRQQFENGAIKFQKFTPEKGGFNNGAIGNPKDHVAFVMPKEAGETLLNVSKGDSRILEDLLGMHPGDLGDSPVAIDIPAENLHNIRIPSGNEKSAFDGYWKPGGRTYPGDMPEAVVDEIPWGNYTFRQLGGH